jgi:hypothetical protein
MAATGERKRSLWAVGSAYVATRLFLISNNSPAVHPDTPSYQQTPSFTGHHTRPWVVPLVQYLLTERQVVIVQAILGALAFFALACAIASTLHDSRARTGVMALVLLLGIVPRITYWDAMMLSESIAISMTLLLIAALVWIDRLPAGAVVLIFTLWLFTRDGHLYLGLLLLIGLAWWGVRNQRVAVPIGVAVIVGWGFFAAANNSVIEGYNVSANVAYRIAPNQSEWTWFLDAGMPESLAFATTQPLERHQELTGDPTFLNWSTTVGPSTYLRFLLEHPRFTFGAIPHVFVGGGIAGESLVDHTRARVLQTPGPNFVWPQNASRYTFILVWAAALTACLLWWTRRLDRRWVLPGALIASTVPHAVLAYQASPYEIARHGVILSLVLVVAAWWCIALGADALLARSSDQPEVASADECNDLHELERVG